jgi:hypothetical protein
MDGDDGVAGAKRPTGSVEVDAGAGTTAEQLARRLEDAVERTMNDLESELAVRKSLRPGVHDELTTERLDVGARER